MRNRDDEFFNPGCFNRAVELRVFRTVDIAVDLVDGCHRRFRVVEDDSDYGTAAFGAIN